MDTRERLKRILVDGLRLEGVDPAGIQDEEPLFGGRLGLDSLDVVELVVLVQKHFQVEVRDMEEGREAFRSVGTLADFIDKKRAAGTRSAGRG